MLRSDRRCYVPGQSGTGCKEAVASIPDSDWLTSLPNQHQDGGKNFIHISYHGTLYVCM